ncbi:MAG: GreA/GreB family elongation factor [Planctomycetota bacterium]|nr:GreA/GreB family elongation factor [Planctomycetota bacterium]
MTLVTHVRKGDWAELEDEWTELMLGDGSIRPVLEALPPAAKRRELPRLLPFVREHAEILESVGRAAEAAELLGTTMLAGGSPGELGKPLYQCALAAYGAETWWEVFTGIAGLVENAPDMRAAWRAFRKLTALKDGRAVYHAKGWGIGRIDQLDFDAQEVQITFSSGRSDRFPFQSAVEIFEVIAEDDPRALVVIDPDELSRRLKEEPLEILKAVLQRLDGQANQHQLKLALGQLGVGGGAYTSFWRRGRKQAETSPWFEVTGAGTKTQVRLLESAADPIEGLKRQLAMSQNLGEALTRVRELLSGGLAEEGMREAGLQMLAELADDEQHPLSQRLAVWMLLREARRETPAALVEVLRAAAAEETPAPGRTPALWATFAKLPGVRDQERCVELLREVYPGDAWIDEAARNLPHTAPGMARALVDAVDSAGRHGELVGHYATLLTRPTAAPTVLVALGERLETGETVEGMPPPLQRAQCLLQLAAFLKRRPASDATSARVRQRLTTLLTGGKPPRLRRMLANADAEALAAMVPNIDRGVDRAIDRLFTSIVVQLAPEVFRRDERPFWEGPGLWTTRPALAKRREELRVLLDVKIPENAEAIGRAAAHGDLSENYEWTAAIEEQRNLTSRAAQMEDEIRSAQLIEDAALPEDTVCPGTAVKLRKGGEEFQVRILGPWEADEEHEAISYRSPLAEGILGRHSGDVARVELPAGPVKVEILSITPIPFDA